MSCAAKNIITGKYSLASARDHNVLDCINGNSLKELHKYQDTISAYNEVLKYDPKYALAYFSKAAALNKFGRYEDAIATYDEFIKYKSDCAEAYYAMAYLSKGAILVGLSKYKEAIDAYELAIKYKPDYAEAYFYKDCALYELNQYEVRCI